MDTTVKKYLENSWMPVPSPEAATRRKIDLLRNDSHTLLSFNHRHGPFSNWVLPNRDTITPDDFERILDQAESFFSEIKRPFSWLVFAEMTWLEELLLAKGFSAAQIVEILGVDIDSFTIPGHQQHRISRVETDAELRSAMQIDDSYDEYTSEQFEFSFERNLKSLVSGEETWFLGYDDEKPVAMAAMNVIEEQKIGYLDSARTLPEFQRQGFYTDLVRIRLQEAKNSGCRIVATHADQKTSAPVLRRLGFTCLSHISVYQRLR